MYILHVYNAYIRYIKCGYILQFSGSLVTIEGPRYTFRFSLNKFNCLNFEQLETTAVKSREYVRPVTDLPKFDSYI